MRWLFVGGHGHAQQGQEDQTGQDKGQVGITPGLAEAIDHQRQQGFHQNSCFEIGVFPAVMPIPFKGSGIGSFPAQQGGYSLGIFPVLPAE